MGVSSCITLTIATYSHSWARHSAPIERPSGQQDNTVAVRGNCAPALTQVAVVNYIISFSYPVKCILKLLIDIGPMKYRTFHFFHMSSCPLCRPVNMSLCLGLSFWGWGGAVEHAACSTEGRDHLAWAALHRCGLVAAQHQQATQVYWEGEAANGISQLSLSV